ncbi:hypothetical protein B0T17DRAFT_594824 [Bombardia bombarda]|uniref:Uncharacterized protein n=1 Tax=Bombardia bombarda TaxID=252184 RepID=A0AA39XJJ7_9PEZI|nr:hypothetical protein B0T17DRAFT_594824 [Bombardia bombarda]
MADKAGSHHPEGEASGRTGILWTGDRAMRHLTGGTLELRTTQDATPYWGVTAMLGAGRIKGLQGCMVYLKLVWGHESKESSPNERFLGGNLHLLGMWSGGERRPEGRPRAQDSGLDGGRLARLVALAAPWLHEAGHSWATTRWCGVGEASACACLPGARLLSGQGREGGARSVKKRNHADRTGANGSMRRDSSLPVRTRIVVNNDGNGVRLWTDPTKVPYAKHETGRPPSYLVPAPSAGPPPIPKSQSLVVDVLFRPPTLYSRYGGAVTGEMAVTLRCRDGKPGRMEGNGGAEGDLWELDRLRNPQSGTAMIRQCASCLQQDGPRYRPRAHTKEGTSPVPVVSALRPLSPTGQLLHCMDAVTQRLLRLGRDARADCPVGTNDCLGSSCPGNGQWMEPGKEGPGDGLFCLGESKVIGGFRQPTDMQARNGKISISSRRSHFVRPYYNSETHDRQHTGSLGTGTTGAPTEGPACSLGGGPAARINYSHTFCIFTHRIRQRVTRTRHFSSWPCGRQFFSRCENAARTAAHRNLWAIEICGDDRNPLYGLQCDAAPPQCAVQVHPNLHFSPESVPGNHTPSATQPLVDVGSKRRRSGYEAPTEVPVIAPTDDASVSSLEVRLHVFGVFWESCVVASWLPPMAEALSYYVKLAQRGPGHYDWMFPHS